MVILLIMLTYMLKMGETPFLKRRQDLETGCDSNYIAETPQLARRRQPDKPSAKQYQELAPFERSMANSTLNLVTTREVPVAKLPEQDLKSGGKRVTCNFSSFLGPPALHHVNGQKTGPAALSSAKDRNNNCKRSSPCGNINPLESMPIAPANGSKTVEGFHYQPNFMEPTVELLPLGAKPTDRLLPDNESEAVRRDYASPNQVYGQTSMVAANKAKQKFTNTQKASSSLCSGGASNNPTHTLKRRHDDTEGSADHPSQNIERKAKNVTKAVPGTMNKARSMTSVAPGSKRKRKNRTAEFHNISERKRRDKINEKMRALRKLIPNCNKVDKASMLDEAIEYLKILQLQVQMMSMGNRVCIPQMVLPDGMQQTSPQQMTHFSPMRMQMGVGCNPFPVPPNFLFPPIPGATAVPGFPPQLLPMSLLPAQLALLNPSGSLPGVSLASAPTPLMASVNLSNSKDSIHNINSEEGKKQSC